jgi:glutaredoxin
MLGYRASRRHGYCPLWVGLFASVVILAGKFYFEAELAAYAGVGLLVAALVWNRWPRRAAVAPACCVPPEAGFLKEFKRRTNLMKHKIEIYSAGCKICQNTITTVKKLAGSEHEVIVHDMHQEAIASRAAQQGVKSVPAVVINGKLAGCCASRGVEEHTLREALR